MSFPPENLSDLGQSRPGQAEDKSALIMQLIKLLIDSLHLNQGSDAEQEDFPVPANPDDGEQD